MAASICTNSTLALPLPSSAAFFSVFLLAIYPLVFIYLICSAFTQAPPRTATAPVPQQETREQGPAPRLPTQRPQRPTSLRRRNAQADVRQLPSRSLSVNPAATNSSLATQYPTSAPPLPSSQPPPYEDPSPLPSPPPYLSAPPPPYTHTTLGQEEDIRGFGAVFHGSFPQRTPSWSSDEAE